MSASANKISELCALLGLDEEVTKVAIKVHSNISPEKIQAMITETKAFRKKVARLFPGIKLK